jgi:predicted ester cyclase
MSTPNVQAVLKLFEAFNAGDPSVAETVIAPDYLNYEALDDEEERAGHRGPQEFAASIQWLRSTFSELHFEIEEIIPAEAEQKVVVRALMTGKQTGPFMQFPPSGRGITSEQIHIFRLVESKITEHRARRDDLGMLLQIGALSFRGQEEIASSDHPH